MIKYYKIFRLFKAGTRTTFLADLQRIELFSGVEERKL
jgi:hypothetical protein